MTSVTEDLSPLRVWAEVLVRQQVLVGFVSAPSDPTNNKAVNLVSCYSRSGFVFAHFEDDYATLHRRALLRSEPQPNPIAEPGSACQALSYCASALVCLK